MKIANVSELRDGVNEVFMGSEKYFIHKMQGEIKIYSSVCPHQGGRLFCAKSLDSTNLVGENDEIYCKVHNWRFDAGSGKSSNIQSAKLREVGFRVDSNGEIYLDLAKTNLSSRANPKYLSENPPPIAKSRHKTNLPQIYLSPSTPTPLLNSAIIIFPSFATLGLLEVRFLARGGTIQRL